MRFWPATRALVVVGVLILAISCVSSASGLSSGTEPPLDAPEPVDLTQPSAEEQLVAKYAPIVYLGVQDKECDRDGEAYWPTVVDIVLNNPDIALKRDVPGHPVEMEGPGASDLFDKGGEFFLDYPGNPRRPGCTYEKDFRAIVGDSPTVAYAHIQTEPGFTGLALQYWFFYYFNDWVNLHEGDWEMIQLTFDASSASEALNDEPVRAAYAQHAGGETASWDGGKVRKEDGRPVVYIARGSHASHYEPRVYIGVARDGTGFGCDDASQPLRRVELEARLVPAQVTDPQSPYAWIEFDGRWGDVGPPQFRGPTGPNQKEKWEKPFTWEERLRSYSEKLPEGDVLGNDPLKPVCAIIRYGSFLLNAFTQNPAMFGAGVGFALMAAVGMIIGAPSRLRGGRPAPREREGPGVRVRVGSLGRQAAILYLGHWRLFSLIGAVFLPLSILATTVQAWLDLDRVEDLLQNRAGVPFVVFSVSSLQAFIAIVVVGGAVIAAVGQIEAGQPAAFSNSYGVVFRRFWTLLGAQLRSAFHLILLALSVVGLPWAVHRTISWAFVGQAVILDGVNAKDALSTSADAVRGNWWRTFGMLLGIIAVIILPGPIIGFAFLLFASPSVFNTLYIVNAGLYALLLLPFALIASTLLYSDLKSQK